MTELDKTYSPNDFEDKIYSKWIKEKQFCADPNSTKEPYSIVIPPPNVTGTLHIGHVLNNTLQDILIRKAKMEGKEALWMPGCDHAGIATQNVVEKELAKDGITRHDLGREKFLEKVWEWKDKYGSRIILQLQKLGCSCDWDKLRFTMDEGLTNSVNETFVSLYKKDLIYRGEYIVNWCPRCNTALSDEENVHKDKPGKLWHLKYPLKDGKGSLIVATTRPETMLGDTAVAVNPDDERYKDLVGQTLLLPLTNREIPIIADKHVASDFGSGCVKVTPAHDPNDFEIGERHNLEKINILNADATMNANVPEKYKGLERFACRKAVLADLEAEGLLVKIEDHDHSVGHCERCHTVTEPWLSTQWFVKYDKWVKPALKAIDDGKLNFHPNKWEKTFSYWLENIRDWCISRQLWWGHRIPVWYCECGEITVDTKAPEKCHACGSTNLRQDEDVLDTWFSSWLWTFSTMGWPEKTDLLKKFYPTNVLVTGGDIIFFWVARMVFAGIEFMDELPFKDVYFNSIVRDLKGRKMSKSLGNSADPIDLIDKYGADALRYTVVSLAPIGQDVIFGEEKCELGRNFVNKLWNSARFVMMHLDKCGDYNNADAGELEAEDKWIISRCNDSINLINDAFDKFNFNEALNIAYRFTWNDFCDWYIELVKNRFYDETNKASMIRAAITLKDVFSTILKLLHPFIPFATEEINSVFCETEKSLLTEEWPKANNYLENKETEKDILHLKEVVSTIRNLRAEKNIPPKKPATVSLIPANKEKEISLKNLEAKIKILCKIEDLNFVEKEVNGAVSGVAGNTTIFLHLDGLIDVEAEKAKIKLEIEKVKKFTFGIEKKLSNKKFVDNAPVIVIDKEKQKLADNQEKINKLNKMLETL